MINDFPICLLRRHVGQFSLDEAFMGGGIVTGSFGNPKINNFYLSLIRVENILGIYITVDDVQRSPL